MSNVKQQYIINFIILNNWVDNTFRYMCVIIL